MGFARRRDGSVRRGARRVVRRSPSVAHGDHAPVETARELLKRRLAMTGAITVDDSLFRCVAGDPGSGLGQRIEHARSKDSCDSELIGQVTAVTFFEQHVPVPVDTGAGAMLWVWRWNIERQLLWPDKVIDVRQMEAVVLGRGMQHRGIGQFGTELVRVQAQMPGVRITHSYQSGYNGIQHWEGKHRSAISYPVCPPSDLGQRG